MSYSSAISISMSSSRLASYAWNNEGNKYDNVVEIVVVVRVSIMGHERRGFCSPEESLRAKRRWKCHLSFIFRQRRFVRFQVGFVSVQTCNTVVENPMPIDSALLASLEGPNEFETLKQAVEKNPDDFNSWSDLLSKLDDQVGSFPLLPSARV